MTILANGRLIFPDGIRDGLDVIVADGKIAEIGPVKDRSDEKVIDLAGNFLAPGFIDIHVHGAMRRDTMEGSAAAFRAIADYHATGGTTSLLLTTATAPLDEIVHVIEAARNAGSSIKQIAGVHVEGPFISKEKAGAQRKEFIQNPSPKTIDRLIRYADVIKRITIAPEIPGAIDAIEKFSGYGISVSGGHSDAWEEEGRAAFARGMGSVTHTFNCMSSMRRAGIYRKGGLLEVALSEPAILCELIADGHHVSATLMELLYRAKGPSGICLVTDATAGAGLPEGSRFSLAGIDCVVEGGVCLLADRSALAGSASRMIDLVRTMVNQVEIPLHEAITMATQNPARAIRLEGKGRLEAGADADLVVLSSDLEVLETFVAGERVFTHSRSGGF